MNTHVEDTHPKTDVHRSVTNIDVASEVEALKIFDPALGAYNFGDLGQAVQFSNLMCRAGEMLPPHLRDKPALCLAVTMRAKQWGMDPFGLAGETYQAQSGGVIAYQAKVFTAALRTVAKVVLNYEFTGTVTINDKPALSSKGNQVAKKSATGDRRCIAWVEIKGVRYDYETPKLDDITVKNSPLWHLDPDQQLSYYAGRGWTRRHRSDVIMGAYSDDEVQDMEPMRDVTPKENGFARLAREAREKAEVDAAADPAPVQTATQDVEGQTGETIDGEVATDAEPEIDPEHPAYQMGQEAAADDMFERSNCPFKDDAVKAQHWLAGFDTVEREDAE